MKKNYKHITGYLYNDHKVKPLHKFLPKTSAYVKSYNEQTKWIHFLMEDDDFGSQLAYDKNFLKTKIKSHGDEVTGFYDKKIPRL